MEVSGIPVLFDPACERIAMACGVWPAKRIVVGPSWYSLTGEERAAALFHEVGHCRMFHMERRLLALPLMVFAETGRAVSEWLRARARRHEIAADRFAASAGYQPEMVAVVSRYPQPRSEFYPSTEERVAALKGVSP